MLKEQAGRKETKQIATNSFYERSVCKRQEQREPNLFRQIFPYTEVCRTPFDHRIIPITEPAAGKLSLTDTTFRDGQQARPAYAPGQLEDLFKLIKRLGGPIGIIRRPESFLSSKKDREAVARVLALGHRYPEVTDWIRANEKDLQPVKETGLKETGILTSCSDYHIFLRLNKTRKQALEDYLAIIKKEANIIDPAVTGL